MDPALVAEAEEEMFAVGVDGVENPAVEERRAVGELALRAADPGRPAAEAGEMVLGEPVDRMPLGHGVSSVTGPRCTDRPWAVAWLCRRGGPGGTW